MQIGNSTESNIYSIPKEEFLALFRTIAGCKKIMELLQPLYDKFLQVGKECTPQEINLLLDVYRRVSNQFKGFYTSSFNRDKNLRELVATSSEMLEKIKSVVNPNHNSPFFSEKETKLELTPEESYKLALLARNKLVSFPPCFKNTPRPG